MCRNWRVPFSGLRYFAIVLMLMLFSAENTAGAQTAERYFTVLHTNDEHSALLPVPFADYHPDEDDPTVGGFVRLGRLIGDTRAAKEATGEPVIVVSAGDIMAGSPYSWLLLVGEAAEISLMQQIGYDVITLGNHEFDYGPEALARYYRAAGYPEANADTALVSSNLIIPNDHPLGDCIQDTHIIVLENGLRLGFFGVLGRNAAKLAVKKTPIEISDPTAAARTAVRQLRDRDVDVVIGVTHAGFHEDEAIAKAVPGIDVMFTGHYHNMVMDPPIRVGNTILAQSSAYTRQVGVLELAFNPVSGALRLRNEDTGQPYQISVDDSIGEEPAVAGVLAEYTDKLDRFVNRLTDGAVTHISDPVLYSEFVLAATAGRESILGNFVTDAMRLVVEERTGERVDFAIQANGVLRGDVSPGTMPHSLNKINFYSLASAIGLGTGYDDLPGYPLASIYLTGNELYRMLELSLLLAEYADVFFLQLSGGRVAYDPSRLVLFEIPFKGWPVPTLRAVQSVERFTGDGLQNESDDVYQRIPRGDKTLYHVVCDYYVLSFFPRLAEMLPVYKVIPKDRQGNPLPIRDAIIHDDAGEFKLWQAVVAHALSQLPGENGIPQLPEHYAQTGARIRHAEAYPLARWAIPALLLPFLGIVLLCRRLKRRKTADTR